MADADEYGVANPPDEGGAHTQNEHGLFGGASLMEMVEAVWNNLQGLLHDQLQLAALEAQRAGKSLATILIYAIVVGVLLVSSWLCLVGAAVFWCVHNGMNISIALLLALIVNLLGALGFVIIIWRQSTSLRFPATLNTLKTPFNAGANSPSSSDQSTGRL